MTQDERGTFVKAIAAAALTWALDDLAREPDDPSTLIDAAEDDGGRGVTLLTRRHVGGQ
jgi:hypothetical protein